MNDFIRLLGIALRLPFFLLGVVLYTPFVLIGILGVVIVETLWSIIAIPFVIVSCAWNNRPHEWEEHMRDLRDVEGRVRKLNPFGPYQWMQAWLKGES